MTDVPQLRTAFNLDGGSALTPEDAHRLLTSGTPRIEFRGGLALRVSTLMSAKRIELTGFGDTEVEQLKAFGFFSEIVAWRLRLFAPLETESGVKALSRLFALYPPLSAAEPAAALNGGMIHERRIDLSRRLAGEVEAVCRAYLPAGLRQGRYWIVGDVQGTAGRSLFVKLSGDRAGKWMDAATGEHGDLLDLIHLNQSHAEFRSTLDEARRFLHDPEPRRTPRRFRPALSRPASQNAAAKLYSLSRPVTGTLAETYLRQRSIAARLDWPALRFHPACYYRAHRDAPRESWPALLGIVTDLAGNLTGLQRTWLARDGSAKAPVADPRRAMGHLLGNAVRFGQPGDVMAAGEGIETVLSLLSLLPAMPIAAALSAAHLAAIMFPPSLRRLYILRDNDAAGDFAEDRLTERCHETQIEPHILKPIGKDLNVDLCRYPSDAVKAAHPRAAGTRRRPPILPLIVELCRLLRLPPSAAFTACRPPW